MDLSIGSGEDSFDILDWNPQEESPPEKSVCLCSRLSKDMGEHDPVMCEWYSAMDRAARLTGIPSGLEDSFNSVGDPDAVMTEALDFSGEQFGLGVIGEPHRNYVSGWVVHNHSDLEVAPPFNDKPMLRLEDLWDRPEPYDLQRNLDVFEAVMKKVPPVTFELDNALNDVPGASTPLTHGPNAPEDGDQKAALQVHTDLRDTADSRNPTQQTDTEDTVKDTPGPMSTLLDEPDMEENDGQKAAPKVHTDLDDIIDGRNQAQLRDLENTMNDALVPTTPLTLGPDSQGDQDQQANHGPDTHGNHDQRLTHSTDMCPDDTTCGQVSARRRDTDARRQHKRREHKQRMDRITAELNRREENGEGKRGDLSNFDRPQQSLPPIEDSAASTQDVIDDFLDELSPDWVG